MEGQRQQSGGGGRRRRRKQKKRKNEPSAAKVEPVMIVARRPDSPRMMKVSGRGIAASARPKSGGAVVSAVAESDEPVEVSRPRRTARMISTKVNEMTEEEMREERLLERLRFSEGRSAITQSADALFDNDIAIPDDQEVQLQLLQHNDERRADAAVQVITRLLKEQTPIKRPILDQRLRRLEDEAEEQAIRERAAELRRLIRAA